MTCDGRSLASEAGFASGSVSCCVSLRGRCCAAGGLRRRWSRRRREGGGWSAALPEHFGSGNEHLPNRIRAPAGNGEQLQENAEAKDQTSTQNEKAPSSHTSVSTGGLGLVVRRHVPELLTPCARPCEGQRRGPLCRPSATGTVTASSPSTRHHLRRRSRAAKALVRPHVPLAALECEGNAVARHRQRRAVPGNALAGCREENDSFGW
jgi:hypothetical protein